MPGAGQRTLGLPIYTAIDLQVREEFYAFFGRGRCGVRLASRFCLRRSSSAQPHAQPRRDRREPGTAAASGDLYGRGDVERIRRPQTRQPLSRQSRPRRRGGPRGACRMERRQRPRLRPLQQRQVVQRPCRRCADGEQYRNRCAGVSPLRGMDRTGVRGWLAEGWALRSQFRVRFARRVRPVHRQPARHRHGFRADG